MIKRLFAFLLLIAAINSMAQMRSISRSSWRNGRYILSGGVGAGSAYWFSNFDNSELYDKNGSVLRSGSLNFTAQNSTSIADLNVLFPLTDRVRLGMGISFEEFFLDKLNISATVENKIVLFDETFRFDKIFIQGEYQFYSTRHSNACISANARIGYFGYNGIDRINFFGEEVMAKKYFGTLGIVGEYKLFNHAYAFLFPQFEFKYFKNSNDEAPSDIRHNIITLSVNIGLRIDFSKD